MSCKAFVDTPPGRIDGGGRVECELPEGHEGPHQGTLYVDRMEYRPRWWPRGDGQATEEVEA